MKDKQTSRTKHFDFIILDIIVLETAYLFAYYIILGRLSVGEESIPGDYRMMNMIILLAHVAIVFFTENYSGIIRRGYLRELQAIFIYNCELLGVILVFLFFSKQSEDYSRIVIATFIAFNMIFMYIERILRKRYLRRIKKNLDKHSRMLIISDEENAYQTTKDLRSYNYSPFSVYCCD